MQTIECLLAMDDCLQDTEECLLNIPSFQGRNNPLTMINLQNHQRADADLIERANRDPHRYHVQNISGSDILCHRETPSDNWRICLPLSLVHWTIRWYHLLLGHCGIDRLCDTLKARFYHPGLYSSCSAYRCPDNCHMYKHQGRSCGHHAPRMARASPWEIGRAHV